MKTTMIFALSLFLGIFVLQLDPLHAKPKSYPLMCRGGSAMKTTLWHKGIKIHFRGGSQGAQVRPPGFGQCTWLDRGFRPGEPQVMDWVADGSISQLAVSFDPPNRITGMDIKGNPREVANYKYLFNKIRNSEVFQVHAFLDTCGKGVKCPFLTITRVGP